MIDEWYACLHTIAVWMTILAELSFQISSQPHIDIDIFLSFSWLDAHSGTDGHRQSTSGMMRHLSDIIHARVACCVLAARIVLDIFLDAGRCGPH